MYFISLLEDLNITILNLILAVIILLVHPLIHIKILLFCLLYFNVHCSIHFKLTLTECITRFFRSNNFSSLVLL